MALDRNQFKGATLNSIKDEQSRAAQATPGGNTFDRPGFHTIVDGKNWRRVAPSHDPKEPAYRAKSTVKLNVEVPKVDSEGKETGEKEMKMRNIFIATQHSLTMTEDPILTYIDFVKKRATDESKDKDARSKFLAPITGWRGTDKKWNWGITPMLAYVCYAWDEKGELGRQELRAKSLDDMKKVSIAQADDNAEIIPDIFTDPDEGYPLIITQEKNDKGKVEHIISCELLKKGESWAEFFDRNRLTDEQLTDFMSKESLADLYKDVYTTRDWNLAIDGLQRFDVQYKFGIFQNEEFIAKLEEIEATVPAYVPKNERVADDDAVAAIQNYTPKTVVAAETAPPATAPEENTALTPLAMKRFLKAFIAENYGADRTLPELSKDELLIWYNLAQGDNELPFDDISTGEEIVDTPAPIDTPAPVTGQIAPNPVLQSQIDALRRKKLA